MILDRLNDVNDITIHSVHDKDFLPYGRIVKGYDCSALIAYMESRTTVPEQGNVYLASVPELEAEAVKTEFQTGIYGGMEIQIGYCNGHNTTYNGFEYHKGSELNIAVTDFMLVLGHSWDIQDNTYHVDQADVFFVERGTVIELYQTTLHLSPCRVCDEGFKDIVVLPKGTNTPLAEKPLPKEPEGELLLMKNKWVIAHPEREPLIRQGAVAGVIGVNRELKY